MVSDFHIAAKGTYTLDSFFQLWKFAAVNWEYTSVHLYVSGIRRKKGLTIAFMGWNPGKGSTRASV
jgi:hypothetical protein